jgi:hypothetical protein
LGADPKAAVARRRRGRGELPGEPTDGLRLDPGPWRGALRREGAHRLTDLLDPVGEAREPTGSGQLLSKDGVDDGEEQQDVGPWADREVGVGQVGGAGPPRIDHDQPAPPRP